ncbi:unnamed protein product [Didymodactylos carnosus]|uniref:Tropomodulin n=1 Tax=Didymodactylos carnosus TaxID=1234261 RepID=A0A814BBA3_9BILA|nr:unnamed protein product [Didymodactylos carnosus]CAF1405628.1 unnamed protein product [Didymodactylos carnosus]CAF3702617.1 unnamed protein product [Didymodactylos carnosus]CAF4211302.1 unnamed protein product [Didymodactylos carnosus]
MFIASSKLQKLEDLTINRFPWSSAAWTNEPKKKLTDAAHKDKLQGQKPTSAHTYKDEKKAVSEEIESIVNQLKSGKLTSLNLNRRLSSTGDTMAIAEALKINTTLTGLGIYNNNISDEGVMAIAEALKVNTTLTGLGIYNNNISEKQKNAIKRAWSGRSSFLYL